MYATPSWGMLATSAVLLFLTGTGVTAGYHRLYSHITYKVNPIVEGILLFLGTMATQGSALRWSYDHRLHHAFVDSDRDPYSIKKGFWYAHFLWLFEKPREIEDRVVADLLKKPLLRFQHRYYGLLMVLTNGLVFLGAGAFFGDYFGAFLFIWFVRLFFLHHFTWFINSLAHTWGARTFCQELSAVDNYLISLVTFGEGYHNYHHAFAQDYRNGIRWYHFDPTKWLIWTLNKVGLASKLKKQSHYFLEEKVFLDRKKLILEKVQQVADEYKGILEDKTVKISESFLKKLSQMKELKKAYQTASNKQCLRELRGQIKTLKKGLKAEYKNWMAHYRQIMRLSAS